MSLPLKLKNFNLFNEGQNYIGKVPELALPKLTAKMEEFRAGGMDAPIDIDLGMEKLEMEWTIGGFEAQVLKQFGTLTHNGVGLRFAGALQSDDLATSRPSKSPFADVTRKSTSAPPSRATTLPKRSPVPSAITSWSWTVKP